MALTSQQINPHVMARMREGVDPFYDDIDPLPTRDETPPAHAATGGPERRFPVAVEAKGSHYRLQDGREILDAASGALNVNLGHAHPRIVSALQDQVARSHFYHRGLATSPENEALRETLLEMAGPKYSEVLFTNSGSEGIEQALRVVRRFHQKRGHDDRTVLLSEEVSYHGMTGAALLASGHPGRRKCLNPAYAERTSVFRVPVTPDGRATPRAWVSAIQATGSRGEALIVETVTGASGGAGVLSDLSVFSIREEARKTGIPVIADEVMTGLGRLGETYTSIERGLEPDIIVVSKGLGAGYFPLGAVLVSSGIAEELKSDPDLGTFGHTMAGNPLAARTALAVLDVLAEEDLLNRVLTDSCALRDGLEFSTRGSATLGEPRGKGFIWALPLINASQKAWRKEQTKLMERAWDLGLALYPAGTRSMNASILVAPPLNITPRDLDELFDKIHRLAY